MQSGYLLLQILQTAGEVKEVKCSLVNNFSSLVLELVLQTGLYLGPSSIFGSVSSLIFTLPFIC